MPRLDSSQRAHILLSAIPVFADKGLKGASIRLVASAAKVNSALIYYYFEDKTTLFEEVIRQVIRGFLEHLASSRREFVTASDRLAFLVDGIFDYYGAHPERMKLMAAVITQHGDHLRHVFEQVFKEEPLVPLRVMLEGMEKGELRRQNPVQAWWSILGACVFAMQMRVVMRDLDTASLPAPLPSVEECRLSIIQTLCEGMKAREEGIG